MEADKGRKHLGWGKLSQSFDVQLHTRYMLKLIHMIGLCYTVYYVS